jgi:hypothetical protein
LIHGELRQKGINSVSCCGQKQKGNKGVVGAVFMVGGHEVNVSPEHPADDQGGNNRSSLVGNQVKISTTDAEMRVNQDQGDQYGCMQIFVKTLTAKTNTLRNILSTLSPTSNPRYRTSCGFPPDQQCLVFTGKQL